MISFSAKDLCSRSAMQIKFFSDHPEKRPLPNANVMEGVSWQDEVAKNVKGVIGQEMRGTFSFGDGKYIINFTNDIVCQDKIIEVKSVRGEEYEQWYFESSLLQCAVYLSLLRQFNGKLVTAEFYKTSGHPVRETVVKNDIRYFLYFGKDKYLITVVDDQAIRDFVIKKAMASLSWDGARAFDDLYKHKEFEMLKKYFKYDLVDGNE